jgi:hypothetical protein
MSRREGGKRRGSPFSYSEYLNTSPLMRNKNTSPNINTKICESIETIS